MFDNYVRVSDLASQWNMANSTISIFLKNKEAVNAADAANAVTIVHSNHRTLIFNDNAMMQFRKFCFADENSSHWTSSWLKWLGKQLQRMMNQLRAITGEGNIRQEKNNPVFLRRVTPPQSSRPSHLFLLFHPRMPKPKSILTNKVHK